MIHVHNRLRVCRNPDGVVLVKGTDQPFGGTGQRAQHRLRANTVDGPLREERRRSSGGRQPFRQKVLERLDVHVQKVL